MKPNRKEYASSYQKNCPFVVTDVQRDPLGRFLFLKGSLHNKTFTIANLYAPNSRQVPFFRHTLQLLTTFSTGSLIVGGDFNVPLDPSLDTSNGTSSSTNRALRAIKTQFRELLLHDAWRTLHPTDKDFTFFSPPHSKYSRIDYFFISQRNLPVLHKSSIEPMILADHNPVSITLHVPSKTARSHIWRLDNSLLTDTEISHKISEHLSNYFSENGQGDSAPEIVWAAHKCVIRGTFLSQAAHRNRLRKAKMENLTTRISVLE